MCAGDESAVTEFIESFGPQVEIVIRSKLSPSLRKGYDTVDFSQMVWASFYRDRSVLTQFKSRGELISYLTNIARNKLISELRWAHRSKRGGARKPESLEEMDPDRLEFVSNDPTPSQIMVAEESLAAITEGQKEHVQRIIELKSTGLSGPEIADHLGVSQRTVRRVLAKVAPKKT